MFDTKRFLDWADAQTEPVFISEYNISDSRFKIVASLTKRSMISTNKDKCIDKIEKLYCNRVAAERLSDLRKETLSHVPSRQPPFDGSGPLDTHFNTR